MSSSFICPYCGSSGPRHYEDRAQGRGQAWCGNCGSPVEEAHQEEQKKERTAPAQPKILYIDNDRLLLGLFVETLAGEGFQALTAADGPSGIETAKKERPDLILLDIIMPRMSGFEVCRRLRAEAGLKDVPIILMTAVDDPDLSAKGSQAGATVALAKPSSPTNLVEIIKAVLTSRNNGNGRARGSRPSVDIPQAIVGAASPWIL